MFSSFLDTHTKRPPGFSTGVQRQCTVDPERKVLEIGQFFVIFLFFLKLEAGSRENTKKAKSYFHLWVHCAVWGVEFLGGCLMQFFLYPINNKIIIIQIKTPYRAHRLRWVGSGIPIYIPPLLR